MQWEAVPVWQLRTMYARAHPLMVLFLIDGNLIGAEQDPTTDRNPAKALHDS
jgi:hypothetical protein